MSEDVFITGYAMEDLIKGERVAYRLDGTIRKARGNDMEHVYGYATESVLKYSDTQMKREQK